MIKKLLITTIATTSVLAFVNAESNEGKLLRAMPVKMMASATMPMMGGEGAPRTGDAVIDGKIATLVKEREDKIKAIRQEYEAKIKAVIGDKKVLMKEMMASGTREMMERRDDWKKASGTREMMERRDDWKNASGTRPMMGGDRMMNGSGTRPMMKRPEGADRPKPMGLFEGFFKSFFGGNPKELEAQEVQQ
jgi:hypothetical protein